jgi:hypothetical protein
MRGAIFVVKRLPRLTRVRVPGKCLSLKRTPACGGWIFSGALALSYLSLMQRTPIGGTAFIND